MMSEDTIPVCPPPAPDPHPPTFDPPAGATDCHAHVFGPAEKYPYQPNRAYTPHDAPVSALREMHRTLGIERLVVVQASAHGTDNSAVLDAIRSDPVRIRGVGALAEDTSDAEIETLNAAGIRGFRVNLVDKGGMPFRSLDSVAEMSRRVAPFGWHLELLVHVETNVAELRDLAERVTIPISIGHVGYTRVKDGGERHAGFREFAALLRDADIWVKLTAPYRISAEETPPYSDTRRMVEAVVEAAPDRILWGSDWPHVIHYRTMPNDGDLFNLLADWVPDPGMRRRILVDNPARHYGFA
jgi:2-pyrone-4,6-dicarboxylate lactonase